MKKKYDPHTIEQHWYTVWEENNYFSPQGNVKSPYCIMIPPPNITGRLHMGHGFQYTLMDILVRYKRMCGDHVLWQVGTDHAGIATQLLVENALHTQGKTRQQLGRSAFTDAVWQWKQEHGNTITKQMRRIGNSVDWQRNRFTMDQTLSQAVHEVFIHLYQQQLIYRGYRLVNWDPTLQTAISDLEVTSEPEDGHLWHIRFPLAKKPTNSKQQDHLIVATTRPETLLGDTAVAVHPDDTRYQHLIGQKIALPLTDRIIPIIADSAIDPEFGSGCVKITPAHDFNDYAIGQRHKLPHINIFTAAAVSNTHVPKPYQQLDRNALRKKICADLTQQKLLLKVEPHRHNVPRGSRSGSVIEPRLTQQWFVSMRPLAQPALQAVRSGQLNFVPKQWEKIYCQWLENIEDWCISRQLWWGHRIPAWYDKQDNIYVGKSEQHVRAHYKLDPEHTLTQDPDVLDTWFSSALWPFATLGWPEKTTALDTFYPTNVLVTGFDIIFFWVARMVMMGLKFTGKSPFHTVYITGLIRDEYGKKMSKSKGNIIDPIDLIDGITLNDLLEKRTKNLMQPTMQQTVSKQTRALFPQGIAAHGADAVRFTFCALASNGRDIRFDLARLTGYRNFCNKLWNAARYVLMQMPEPENTPPPSSATTTNDKNVSCNRPLTHRSLGELWIISKLHTTINSVHEAYQQYRFDFAAQTMYEFTWHLYCDWYLEWCKISLKSPETSSERKTTTRSVLLTTLETLLRLLHPIMPFITEEIWQRLIPLLPHCVQNNTHTGHQASLMLQAYPHCDKQRINQKAEAIFDWIQKFVTHIRTLRNTMNIAPNQPVSLQLRGGNTQDKHYVHQYQLYLMQLAKLSNIEWSDTDSSGTQSTASATMNQLHLMIPITHIIDKNTELARLKKKIDKLETEYKASQDRLNNPTYCQKAPSHVVKQQRERVTQINRELEQLQQKYQQIIVL